MTDELQRLSKEVITDKLRYCSSICLEGLRKTVKLFTQKCQRLGQDSNRAPPKYKSRTLLLYISA
jgi:hypothetical protein